MMQEYTIQAKLNKKGKATSNNYFFMVVSNLLHARSWRISARVVWFDSVFVTTIYWYPHSI